MYPLSIFEYSSWIPANSSYRKVYFVPSNFLKLLMITVWNCTWKKNQSNSYIYIYNDDDDNVVWNFEDAKWKKERGELKQ